MFKQTFEELFFKLCSAIEDYYNAINGNRKNPTVVSIINYIQANYFDMELGVDKIAQYVHLSPNYISHLFKQVMNETISMYINHVRIEAAKSLLRENKLSLKDIASAVGYSESNYFMRMFKKITGFTPSGFRFSK